MGETEAVRRHFVSCLFAAGLGDRGTEVSSLFTVLICMEYILSASGLVLRMCSSAVMWNNVLYQLDLQLLKTLAESTNHVRQRYMHLC